VENIIITGHDSVLLELIDGSLVDGPPVADSDEELIDFLVFLASRSEVNARGFSEAQPRLHLRLDGGSRLAAAAWVTPRPSVVIRRHRLMEVTLDDLVERQMLTPVAASFLRAAVKARKSIVVSGAQGAGKTTLVRALVRRDRSLWRRSARSRPSTSCTCTSWGGTRSCTRGRPVRAPGSVVPTGAWPASSRSTTPWSTPSASTSRARSSARFEAKKIWAMIKAMESGTGSISTTHASDAVAAIRKLVTCAMEAGPHVTHTLATSKLASTIDLIVHLDMRTTNEDGRSTRRRRVAEIIALDPGESARPATPPLTSSRPISTARRSRRSCLMPTALLPRTGSTSSSYLAQQEVRS
jgi:pilus assembly protein CpaF